MTADIYNGTSKQIDDITIEVTVFNPDKVVEFKRQYIMKPRSPAKPPFSFDIRCRARNKPYPRADVDVAIDIRTQQLATREDSIHDSSHSKNS